MNNVLQTFNPYTKRWTLVSGKTGEIIGSKRFGRYKNIPIAYPNQPGCRKPKPRTGLRKTKYEQWYK